MSWYSIANEEVNLTIQKVMKENHGDLHAEGVKITALIARSEEGPALKVGGKEALGCIRVTKLTERTLGLGDALMILDGESMMAWSSKRLQAVIDHELRHLMLAKNKRTGEIQRDDEGRPKLRIRPHDFEFGWFARTAELYGEESYEVSQAREIVAAQFAQNFLPGFEIDPDPTGLGAYSGKPEQQLKHVNLSVTKGMVSRREVLESALDSAADDFANAKEVRAACDVKAIGKRMRERGRVQTQSTAALSAVEDDDTKDSDDLDEETTAEFISRQGKKVAAERRKKVHDEVRSGSTAALSAKGTKPKRASQKASTVSA